MSYASVHSKQQMDAIFGVVCAQLVATTIALSVLSYGILQYIRVRHHIHMFVSIFAKPFAQKTVWFMYGLWSRPMGSLHAYRERQNRLAATQLEFSRLAAIEM